MRKSEKIFNGARIYERESQLLERIKTFRTSPSISQETLLKEYLELENEYAKLLKQAIKITLVGDSNQRKLLLANEKIEKQKEELSAAYKKMDILARTDTLTQLPNRRDFLEKFQYEIHRFKRSRRPFCVVMGDIDDFKRINDRYGHECGDFILVAIADLMKSMVRKIDTICRWGGEEFILMLPEATLKGGETAVEGIREKIAADPIRFKGQEISVTVTFGVSEFSDTMDTDTCIKQADEALYQGKRLGKNRVIRSFWGDQGTFGPGNGGDSRSTDKCAERWSEGPSEGVRAADPG